MRFLSAFGINCLGRISSKKVQLSKSPSEAYVQSRMRKANINNVRIIVQRGVGGDIAERKEHLRSDIQYIIDRRKIDRNDYDYSRF